MQYNADDLDLLSRVFYRALGALPEWVDDRELAKSLLLQSIVAAASRGVRDEARLAAAAAEALGDPSATALNAAPEQGAARGDILPAP
jgi:hypothetical protein